MAQSFAVFDRAGNAYLVDAEPQSAPVACSSPRLIFKIPQPCADVRVTKVDPGGQTLFSALFHGDGDDYPRALAVDSAGNLYVAGNVYEDSPDLFVVKFSAESGQPAPYVAPVIAVDASGNAYVAAGGGLTKLGLAGDVLLTRPISFIPSAAATDGDGNPVLAGRIESTAGAIITKFDPSGITQFEARLPGSTAPNAAAVDSAGNIYIAGQTESTALPTTPGTLQPQPLIPAWSLAPGGFVAKYSPSGYGIGPEEGIASQPTLGLAGVIVAFDGHPAPVIYAQSRQLNVLAPFSLDGKETTTVTVTCNGAALPAFTRPVRFSSAGLFRREPNVSAEASAVNQDGTLNSASNPAPAGSIIALWGTGFGPTTPACPTGGVNPMHPT